MVCRPPSWMPRLRRSLRYALDQVADDVAAGHSFGVRVEIEAGPHTVEARGLRKDGNVYTNATYGESEATLQVNVEAGIGQIFLEIDN